MLLKELRGARTPLKGVKGKEIGTGSPAKLVIDDKTRQAVKDILRKDGKNFSLINVVRGDDASEDAQQEDALVKTVKYLDGVVLLVIQHRNSGKIKEINIIEGVENISEDILDVLRELYQNKQIRSEERRVGKECTKKRS